MNSYDLAVRLSLQAEGLGAVAAMAMSSFNNMKAAAGAADSAVNALNARMSGFKGLSQLERDAATATTRLRSLETQLQRMQFMGQAGSRSYQWTAIQYGAAQQTAYDAQQALQIGQQTAMKGALAADAAAAAKQAKATRGVTMMAGGVGLLGVGMAGVDVLDHWIKGAGQLETAMINVKLATGATNQQLQQMERGDIKIALSNQMDLASVEAIRAKAASSGLNSIPQLNALLPELARFAEVMLRTKGYTPEASATTGVQFAHLFSAYSADQMRPLLDQFSRALQTSSATPSEFIHTLSGFVGASRTMYGTAPAQRVKAASDSIAMTSLLDNLGQGGRGGTQLRALLLNTMDQISARGAIHNKALNYLEQAGGGSFFDKQGQFAGFQNMMNILMAASTKLADPKNAATLNRAALTAGGASLAGLLGDPAVVGRFRDIRTQVTGKGSIFSLDAAQGFVNATQQGRFEQLGANLRTIDQLMGQKILPEVVAVSTAFVRLTASVIDFVDQHPTIARFAATFVLVGTALSLLAAPVLMVAGALAVLSAAGVVAEISLGPFLLIILAIVAAVAGVTLLFMNWSTVTKSIGQLFSWLGTQIHNTLLQWQAFTQAAKNTPVLGGAVNGQIPIVSGFGQGVGAGIDALAGDWRDLTHGNWRHFFFGDLGGSGGGYAGPLPLDRRRIPVPAFGVPGGRPGASLPSGGERGGPSQVVHMQPGAIQVHLHGVPGENHQDLAERVGTAVGKQFGKVGKQLDDHIRYNGRTTFGLHPTYRPTAS